MRDEALTHDIHCVLMAVEPIGASWRYGLELARGLGRHGVGVALAVTGSLSAARRHDVRTSSSVEVFEGDFADDAASAREWLLALEERVQPDLVHLHDVNVAPGGWHRPCVLTVRSSVAAWRVATGDASSALRRSPRSDASAVRAADLLVTPTEAQLDDLRQHASPLPAALVVADGLAATVVPARKQPIIATCRSGWDELGRVWALSALDPSWALHVLPDAADDGARWTAGIAPASIFALPVRYEPSGVEIADAAHAGAALVLPDLRNLRERWDGAAVFVDPTDRVAVGRALRRLAEDPAQCEHIARAGRSRARAHGQAVMVDGYLDAYTRVLRHEAPDHRAYLSPRA